MAKKNSKDSKIPNEEHLGANYIEAIKEYLKIINSKKRIKDEAGLHKIADTLLDAMNIQYRYDTARGEFGWNEQLELCKWCIKYIIPLIEQKIRTIKDPNLLSDWYTIYEKAYLFAGKRSLRYFLLALEFRKPKKVWVGRIDLFAPIIYFLNKMALDNEIELTRISMPPGFGKSYLCTCFSAFYYGIDKTKAIMRISCSDMLVKQFGRDVVDILRSEEYVRIFDEFKDDPFFKRTEDEFYFKGCSERNFMCITRDSRIVGFRTNVIIEDDLIGGTEEALKDELHVNIINKHKTDWTSRTKDSNLKIISIGTMFSPVDLLNWLKKQAEDTAKYDKIASPFPENEWVEVYRHKETGKLSVFITIPALDKNDKSTLESEFSTVNLLKKRDEFLSDTSGIGNYLWQCVYMQNPIPPTGLNFAYDKLTTYDELPAKEIRSPYCTASLDPARKGKNFVSMPIFNYVNDKNYLVDCIFKKEAMSELYNYIVDKIKEHNIIKMWVEINTDTSLIAMLEAKCMERGVHCEFVPIYSVLNKEQRIKDTQGYVKQMIVFPSRGILKNGSELRAMMEQITSFSFDRPNRYDDGIDSVVLYIMQNLPNMQTYATVECFNRIF